MVVNVNITIFRDTKLCSWCTSIKTFQRNIKTSVPVHQTTWCHSLLYYSQNLIIYWSTHIYVTTIL